ncbi:MAG TPA: Maf family nucleotide pyrophosphatase [Vitreimonas sp.]|uniref:Maf family protein n=1 Tax=Vitreimonas sp. TaxID=3069702 RepID=UPI002D644080|nr:Maf family nucleotide pyrophosphatase [Vitreimonas sp.]HYD89579.1 Maf family nucleotide pyrophosphatase [Vitreimonas sp.]
MTPLILASASAARREMMDAAGLVFEVDVPRVDEEAAKASLRAEGLKPRDQAEALAELKALSVSRARAGFVIGADQMLAVEGRVLDKPKDTNEAREHLLALRGRTHELLTAAVVATDGAVIWRHIDTPRLRMRAFSDAFLDQYLAQAGEKVLRSVGAYQLEGLGAQLFERVEGDYFSILGLPLLPLLAFLREHGVVPA